MHTSDGSLIVDIDPDRKVIAIDIERYLHVLWMQIRTGRIMKASDFAAGQDDTTNSVSVAEPTIEAVPKVQRTQFVLISAVEAIIAWPERSHRR